MAETTSTKTRPEPEAEWDAYVRTEAKAIYGKLLDEITEALGADRRELVNDLDEMVGERIAQAEDRGRKLGAAEVARVLTSATGDAERNHGGNVASPERPDNQAMVTRGGFTVSVEEEGGADVDEMLMACKDAVGALGFRDASIAEAWKKVYDDWMAPRPQTRVAKAP